MPGDDLHAVRGEVVECGGRGELGGRLAGAC